MNFISFSYKGKKFSVQAKNTGFFGKIFGLMFKSRENASALFFEFKKPTTVRIHSLFVFFPFIAVWLDKKGKVIEIKNVKPFTFSISSKKSFYKLLEIPINKKYERKIRLLFS